MLGWPKLGLLTRAGSFIRRGSFLMSYVKSALLDEKGFVILDAYDQAADPRE